MPHSRSRLHERLLLSLFKDDTTATLPEPASRSCAPSVRVAAERPASRDSNRRGDAGNNERTGIGAARKEGGRPLWVGLALLDERGRIRLANRAAEDFLGSPRKSWPGATWPSFPARGAKTARPSAR